MSHPSGPPRLESLREMYAANPKDSFVAYALALELAKSPATEAEASRTFRSLLAGAPDYLPAYLQFGMLLSRRGESEEARTVFEEGIAVSARAGDRHARDELQAALAALGVAEGPH